MKIILPIAGVDKNFLKTFGQNKILCKVGNKSMIENFCSSISKKYELIILCRSTDIMHSNLLEVLSKVKNKRLVILDKLTSNAIETIIEADHCIKNKNEDVLIAHPDGINEFNFIEFTKQKRKYHGIVFGFDDQNQTNTSISHTGRVDIDKKFCVTKVLEKSLKTQTNKTLSGIYYFRSWSEFQKYSKLVFKNQRPVNGLFFVSQVYNEYIRAKKKIKFFKVEKFIDLGSPSLVNEYNFWFEYFKKNYKKKLTKKFDLLNLIPSCGEGKRFLKENKNSFKPLIEVDNNNSLIKKTVESLPKAKKNVIIIRKDHDKKYHFSRNIRNIKNKEIIILNKPTDGMARTCYNYLKNKKTDLPILMSSCDYSLIFDEKKLTNYIKHLNPDVMIWSYRSYPDPRLNPYAYAYLEIGENGFVTNISEKKPISSQPHKDLIVQGIFYFKNKSLFIEAAEKMFEKKDSINGEYYVGNSINQLIKNNYKVIPFEVDQYICLGTPEDFKVYKFWKNYF